MKSSDKPEISKKWWTSEKPDDIEGKDLVKALDAAEKALADADRKCDAKSIDDCLGLLKALGAAVDKTLKKECDKKKHKEVIAVLEKYDRLIGDEKERLEKAKAEQSKGAGKDGEDGEDEEEEKGVLKPEYLARMIKQLRSGGEMQFCFGLDKQSPTDSRLVLCNKRQPERLFKILKGTGDFSKRLMTFGTATADGKVIEMRLADNAKEPSQICKLAKEFFKGNRELKFKKVRVVLGGETFEEEMPEAGEESEPAAAATGQPAAGQATPGSDGASAPTPEDLRKEFKLARKKWVAVREKAEEDLEVVKDGVRNHYMSDVEQFPIAMNSLKKMDEIMDNLSDDLRDALDAYVSTPLAQQAKLQEFGTRARDLVDSFVSYVDKSPLLDAIDKKEFADVQIKAPVSAALRELAKTIR
jgi:hypothetical protein